MARILKSALNALKFSLRDILLCIFQSCIFKWYFNSIFIIFEEKTFKNILITTIMSKEKSPTKDKNKKEPEKNLKEKRAEKKAKRDSKR